MKKMVAVLAVFAIVTTAAWAQISFEGMVMGRADLANNFITNHGADGGPGDWSEIPENAGEARRAFAQEARLFLNMVNADGTAGATARFWNMGWQGHMGWNNASNLFHAWAWWRPMENLLVQIGENPWGFFTTHQIVGPGFTANEAENSLLGIGSAGAFHYGATAYGFYNLHRNTGFYGGFIHPGISAAFEPIEGLTVLLGIPFAMGNAHGAGPVADGAPNFFVTSEGWAAGMLRSHIGVRYEIDGIGTAAFTVAGGAGYWGGMSSPGPQVPLFGGPHNAGIFDEFGLATGAGTGRFANSPKFYLSFLLTAIENMQVNFGLAYTAPFSIANGSDLPEALRGVTFNFPIEMGLGFQFGASDFAIRARVAALFAGSIERPATAAAAASTENMPLAVGLNIHPTFNLGMFVANLNAGFQIFVDTNDPLPGQPDPEPIFGWHVTPYITVPVSNATVFAGFHVESCGAERYGRNTPPDSTAIRWRIPVGLRFQW